MASSLAALRVSLGLDAAEYVHGMEKANDATKKFQEQTTASLERIKVVFEVFESLRGVAEVFGLTLSAAGLASWAKETLEAAENMKDLADETGSAVETLSRLHNISTISGESFDKFRTIMDRLAAGISGTEDLTTRTAKTMQLLGISARDPATAMEELAKKLNSYADGANKAGIARDLFGKDGVKYLSALKAIAEQEEIGATYTRKQAEDASKLAEELRKLCVQGTLLRDIFLNDVVPALLNFGSALANASKESGGLAKGLAQLLAVKGFSLGAWDDSTSDLKRLQREQEEVDKLQTKIESLKQSKKEDDANPSFLTKIGGGSRFNTDALEQTLGEAKSRLAIAKFNYGQSLTFLDDDAKNHKREQFKPDAPKPLGPPGAPDDPGKKILEAGLKALDASIEQEKKMLETRQAYLDAYYAQGYIPVKQYYDQRDASISEGLQFEQKALNEEKALIEARIKLPFSKKGEGGITETDRADARIKLIDVNKRLGLSEAEAAKQAVLNGIAGKKAMEDYTDSINEVIAKTLELSGDTAAAAKIRNEASTRVQIRRFEKTGDFDAADGVRALSRQSEIQAGLNDETKKFNTIVERNSIAQERLNILQQSGAVSELDALQRTSDMNKALIPVLQARADAAAILAAQSKDPADILKVERLRLEIEKLGQATDLVADRFNKIFGDSFTSAFESVIDGTKSVRDAFKDMEKSIVQSINKIASQMISDSLFGKSGGALNGIGTSISDFLKGNGVTGKDEGKGAGFGMNDRGLGESGTGSSLMPGGIGDLLSSIFGGKGKDKAIGATTADAALTTLSATTTTTGAAFTTMTASTTTLGTAFVTVTTAATEAAAALSAIAANSASGGAGGIGGLFGGGGGGLSGDAANNALGGDYGAFLADGTDNWRGGMATVGERGPEKVYLPKGARVVPADKPSNTKNFTNNIVINLPAGTSRASASQIASAAGLEIARQVRRNT